MVQRDSIILFTIATKKEVLVCGSMRMKVPYPKKYLISTHYVYLIKHCTRQLVLVTTQCTHASATVKTQAQNSYYANCILYIH